MPIDLEDIIAISGLPGLHLMITNRETGIIAEPLEGGKRRFLSIRKHTFTPLQTVSIYSTTDSVDLSEVFQQIREKEIEIPLPPADSQSRILSDYFRKIVPNYDSDRVKISDIKKVLKWYQVLKDNNRLKESDKESDDEQAE